MDFSKLPLFAALSRRMDWLGERQRLLAQNIAHADTPGYAAKDLKPASFRDLLAGGGSGSLQAASTQPAHMAAVPSPRWALAAPERSAETTPSGNAVSLEEELMKLGQTQMDFAATANLYRKQIALLRAAIGRR